MIKFFHKLWIFTIYQLITKTIFVLCILPIYTEIMLLLISSTGRIYLSSADYIPILFSFQGFLAVIITLILATVLVGIDINASIILTALMKEGNYHYRLSSVILEGIKSTTALWNLSGLFLILYIALILPLINIGLTISPMIDFSIPNFITFTIYSNPSQLYLYIFFLTLFTIFSFFLMFTLHFIILLRIQPLEAMKQSITLVKQHFFSITGSLVIKFLKQFGFFLLTVLFVTLPVVLFIFFTKELQETALIYGFLLFLQMASFFAFLTIPITVSIITDLFYQYQPKTMCNPAIRNIKKRNFTIKRYRFITFLIGLSFLLVFFFFNFKLADYLANNYQKIFDHEYNMMIIAHRAGGDLAAENSLLGIEKAIEQKVAYSEIDIQRTKDGHYILNHDESFKRVSGKKGKSTDFTLEEIKHLLIKDHFDKHRPSQPIATLEEALQIAKNRIGLFIELKGSTADFQMVDDVIRKLKEYNALSSHVLISLDYKLIDYIENHYPEVQSGYIYFFRIIPLKDIHADFFLMEEREASEEHINYIHSLGKKAIVWTVNTEESIHRFVNSNIDGIITDYVIQVKEGITYNKQRNKFQILLEELFGF